MAPPAEANISEEKKKRGWPLGANNGVSKTMKKKNGKAGADPHLQTTETDSTPPFPPSSEDQTTQTEAGKGRKKTTLMGKERQTNISPFLTPPPILEAEEEDGTFSPPPPPPGGWAERDTIFPPPPGANGKEGEGKKKKQGQIPPLLRCY